MNWALARRHGWDILLRIEDLDGPRVKPGAIEQTIDLLSWLGLDWDAGPVVQSHDPGAYRGAMRRLAAAGRVYPSELSRSEIEAAASAPQEGAGEVRFPASLRPVVGPRQFDDEAANWRFVVEEGAVDFEDAFAGPRRVRPSETIGDFVVWTKRGQPSYQLAVVVDDARQGVTEIVRGDDLIDSAGRQRLLYRALGLGPEPRYWHLPLVLGADGRRLAKRHGDTRLDTYRANGIPPGRVIALLARWCGIKDAGGVMNAEEFARRLDLPTMGREPIVMTSEDDAWLSGR